MRAIQRYESSGGCVALTFMLAFLLMTAVMGYLGAKEREEQRASCEASGGSFIYQIRPKSICLKR